MARPQPFQNIDDGIVNRLALQGITCYPFEGNSLPGPLPCATCVAEGGAPSFRGPQQGFKLGEATYVVRYYTAFGGMDPALVWEDAYNGLALMLTAFGGDITLGGKVAAITVDRFDIQVVRPRDSNLPDELMVEMFTTIKTAPH